MDAEELGPAPHVHDTNDELIYVIESPVSVLADEEWKTMKSGGLVVILVGTTHTFRNDSRQRVGVLNIFLNGAYEAFMPQLIKMYALSFGY